ncbi:MAG: hypothetical protein M3140_12045 [Actinomycetota bacterium]|nr:hypothetical protein [Actinomycetota bacterium]
MDAADRSLRSLVIDIGGSGLKATVRDRDGEGPGSIWPPLYATSSRRRCGSANDGDAQGAGVISGEGLELVLTLGTGVGSAEFRDGRLGLHLELAHHPA